MQPKPALASRLDPARFCELLVALRGRQRLRRVFLASHPGVPPRPRQWSAMTRVPFFICCLQGRFDVQIWRGDRLERQALGPGEGVWYLADTWVDVWHYGSRLKLRATFDHDHTLLAVKDLDAVDAPDFGDHLATHALPAVPTPCAAAAMRRLSELPVDLPHREQVVRDLAAVVLWELEDQIRRGATRTGPARALWLAMRDHCARHWRSGVDRAVLARRFGISPGHVSRLFREEGGTTLIAHQQELRVRHVCDLLRSSDQDIAGIAAACGFSSANYCIRVFTRLRGCSPARWRRAQAG
ncbi:MAG: helix-turn-helix transcriptional regulator [Planctomycetota bacterium]